MRITIDRAGRVVIPKALRERAGLTPGTEIELRYSDGIIEMTVPPIPRGIVKEGSFWILEAVPGARKITLEEINQAIQDVRDEREREILESIT